MPAFATLGSHHHHHHHWHCPPHHEMPRFAERENLARAAYPSRLLGCGGYDLHDSREAPAPPRDAASVLRVTILGGPNVQYDFPLSSVHQIPPSLQSFEQFVLCPAYDPSRPGVSCAMGQQCRMVHADARGLPDFTVHVNYAWRTLDEVTYPRYPAGETLHVAPPNSRVPTDTMDSGCVLATRALQSKRRPLTHCAHYYNTRRCNMGAECRFVHAVIVDPSLRPAASLPSSVPASERAASSCPSTPLGACRALDPAALATATAAVEARSATASSASPSSDVRPPSSTSAGSDATAPRRPRQHNPYLATPLGSSCYLPVLATA